MWIDRRVLIGVAAVSLLLNVFLLGLVGGRMSATRRIFGHAPRVDGGPIVPRGNVKELPVEDKQAFQAAMTRNRETIRAARSAVRAARATVEADIVAPTFDRDRVSADFAALRKANIETQAAVNEAVVEALSGLPASSREILIRRPEPKRTSP